MRRILLVATDRSIQIIQMVFRQTREIFGDSCVNRESATSATHSSYFIEMVAEIILFDLNLTIELC